MGEIVNELSAANLVALEIFPSYPNQKETIERLIGWVNDYPQYFNQSIIKKAKKLTAIKKRLELLETKLKGVESVKFFATNDLAKKHSKQITAQMTELKNYEKALS